MFNQHAKWLEKSSELSAVPNAASLNLLITSTVWRQNHNPKSGSWSRITSAIEGVGSTFACRIRPPVGVVAGRVGAL